MDKTTVDKADMDSVKESLMINFFKLISKFTHLYFDTIHEWEEYPTVEDLKNKEKFNMYMKKVAISFDIIIKMAKSAKHNNIERVIVFTQKLLESTDIQSNITKLNLIVNNGIILLQLLSAQNDEDNLKVMFQYLTTIVKNFNFAYKNTFASLYEIISNNLSLYNKTPAFFDYEMFFMMEDDYLKTTIIPTIEIEMIKLNESFKEDIFTFFAFDNIDYSNDLDLLYIINVLYELKDFMKYKQTYTPEEYTEYKKKIQQKLWEEKVSREKENKGK